MLGFWTTDPFVMRRRWWYKSISNSRILCGTLLYSRIAFISKILYYYTFCASSITTITGPFNVPIILLEQTVCWSLWSVNIYEQWSRFDFCNLLTTYYQVIYNLPHKVKTQYLQNKHSGYIHLIWNFSSIQSILKGCMYICLM